MFVPVQLEPLHPCLVGPGQWGEPILAVSTDDAPIRSRRKRLLSSYTAGALSLGARMGQQLLLFPAFLVAWGPRLYEDWLIITAAAAFFALIDVGTRPFLHNTMLIAWAARD